MSSFVQAVAIWLVALAIPVQGLAAIVMPMCPPAHHAKTTHPADHSANGHDADRPAVDGATATTRTTSTPPTTPPMPATARHHAAVVDAAASDDVHARAHDRVHAAVDGSGDAGHDPMKCCSALIALAAVTPASTVTRVHARSPAPLHFVARIYRSVTPDGLDRPPKSILA